MRDVREEGDTIRSSRASGMGSRDWSPKPSWAGSPRSKPTNGGAKIQGATAPWKTQPSRGGPAGGGGKVDDLSHLMALLRRLGCSDAVMSDMQTAADALSVSSEHQGDNPDDLAIPTDEEMNQAHPEDILGGMRPKKRPPTQTI